MRKSSSKSKGVRVERELVNRHKAAGIAAERVPLSGAHPSHPGDVLLSVAGRTLQAESKARGNGDGFKLLEKWLGSNDLLFLKRDRQTPLVVVPWELWLWLVNHRDQCGELADCGAAG